MKKIFGKDWSNQQFEKLCLKIWSGWLGTEIWNGIFWSMVNKNNFFCFLNEKNKKILKSSIGDTSVAPVYDYLFSTIVNSIPNPPAPLSLLGKGIVLGKRLINSSKYQLVKYFSGFC